MKQAPSFKIEIIHIAGPLKGQIEEFQDTAIEIGRHPSCAIRFPADLKIISRKHARIEREGNQFKLTDTSTNGTYLNGKLIQEAYLRNGDVITFAQSGPKISFLAEKIQPRSTGPHIPSPSPPPKIIPGNNHPAQGSSWANSRKSPAQAQPEGAPGMQPSHLSHTKQKVTPIVIQLGAVIKSYNQPSVTIGSDRSDDFTVSALSEKRTKFRIFFENDRYWAENLSLNETVTVNNHPLGAPTPLTPGDIITLGKDNISLQFLGEGRFAEV